ncbi:MAG: twin-arginine translocation signal domain-containing protein [Planctomycetaceae bacterium]|nr:twin-arginine translocation signal domain-containing protein [Planctomycetales bacterium]MCB9875592.1 twin-arginine translocation signal domain-containing protein [Planctomycetaceae bacterium]MCB9941683.1 twin-arginine translocation signal domain-containing protein [Planctomycetaceae bacterium]
MPKHTDAGVSRRQFLATSAIGTAATLAAPAILTAKKSDSQIIVGEGDYRFEIIHDWPELPSQFTWQTTHNVAVDKAGNVYVIHEGRVDQPDHPSIFVFDSEGKYIRSFGKQYQGGGHGIEVRQEGNEEFLYVCAYQQVKAFSKLSLTGEVVWHKHAPMESGVYAEGEDTNPQKLWGPNRFLPTNFAFLDDGGFFLADGYGSFFIHRYDKDANWVSKFGGPGDGEGTFKTPHGIWIDRRPGREPSVVICDRAHHTLQYFTLEGKYIETLTGYGLPANVDSYENLLLVPELHARVTLLNEKNEVVAQLGEDVKRVTTGDNIRGDSKKWVDGKFVHPHDACFDNDGNIMVAEWVATGRISKLKRLS